MRNLLHALVPILALSFVLTAPHASARQARPLPSDNVPQNSSRQPSSSAAPVLLTAAQVESLLPATVYYRGQSAPIQLRNAAGARFGADGYLLAAMVDTSGYASSIQETYQLYLITEDALVIGGSRLPPGAYGAGAVNGKLMVMDLGGHPLLQATMTLDESMPRPRPLQLLMGVNGSVKLYLGRSWITVAALRLP